VLASRVAWQAEALREAPFASIDFLQGLGNEVRSDIKVIPHSYEPAALLAAFGLDLNTALDLRTLFLVFYCSICLFGLYRSVAGSKPGVFSSLFVILLACYIFAPQLLGEVSHHFSAIYLAIPGWLLALRSFSHQPRPFTALFFSFASTLVVHLSDVHVAFISLTFVLLALLLDKSIRRAGVRVLMPAAIMFGTIVVLSYLAALFGLLNRDPNLVVSAGTWPLNYYWQSFLRDCLWTLLWPSFAGPLCLYILPLLFFLLAPMAVKATRMVFGLQLAGLLVLILGLCIFGVVLHGIEPLRDKLPSAMRYHLSSIPFLTVLFLVYTQAEVEAALEFIRRSWSATLTWIVTLGALFWLIARYKFNPESEAFLAFDNWLLEPGVFAWRWVGFWLLVVLPLATMIYGLAGRWQERAAWKQMTCATLLLAVVAGGYYVIRAFSTPRHNIVYIDNDFRAQLTHDIPIRLSAMIEESPYASAPRSFVPIAKGIAGLATGRNDKLLPAIELPESLGGRSFVQWRYSYSAQSQALYRQLTGQGPVNFFPPSPKELETALTFARLSDSPFLLSADAELVHPSTSLVKLGSINLSHAIVEKRPLVLNDGLTGKIHLYAIVDVANSVQRPDAYYRRTTAHFSKLPPANEGWSRLPITYFTALRAKDQSGRALELRRDFKGFAAARNNGSVQTITVSSFSLLGLASLLSPLVGWLAWWPARAVLLKLWPENPAPIV